MTVPDLIEKTLAAANAAGFTPGTHPALIEHRLKTGQKFVFEIQSVELREDGSAVVLVTDGQVVSETWASGVRENPKPRDVFGETLLRNTLHHDAEKFWVDCLAVLERANEHQAFCVGLACAAAAVAGGYPTGDILEIARRQDAQAFGHRWLGTLLKIPTKS